jgi:hypothetical protein
MVETAATVAGLSAVVRNVACAKSSVANGNRRN